MVKQEMTLREIAELIDPWERGELSVSDKMAIFERQIGEINRKIAELEGSRTYLQQKLNRLQEDGSG